LETSSSGLKANEFEMDDVLAASEMQLRGMNMKTILRSGMENSSALRKALESSGFLVFEASDGSHDLERLRSFWATVILFDFPMPRMAGLEVLRSLRGTGEGDPEVIVVTHDRIPDAIAAVRLGAVDVLVRPVKSEALHKVVDEAIRRAGLRRQGPDSDQRRIFVAVQPSIIDLLRAKRALDRREFDEAERLLRAAIHLDSDSAVAHNLMGLLQERTGRHHASYRSFCAAVTADREYEPALENLRRSGIDLRRATFHPMADRLKL
jgi:DNA-binding response OmpR family regulator